MLMQNRQNKVSTPEERSSSEILRSLIAQLVKVSFFALAALIVIFVGTRAWFVANNRVTADGMQIQGRNSLIRLATTGSRQRAEEEYLKVANGEKLPDGQAFLYPKQGQTETYYYTEDGAIALRMNGQKEVSPGATGKVTFYIIPSQNGELNTTVYLQLAGYQVVNGAAQEIPNNQILKTLLNGHILLFLNHEGEDEGEDVYSGWLGSDVSKPIPISIPDAEQDTPVAFTVYWIWPLRYENMVPLSGDETYTNWMEEQIDANRLTPISGINYCYNNIFLAEKGSDLSGRDDKDNAYNLADEFIGTNAEYLYLTIRTAP